MKARREIFVVGCGRILVEISKFKTNSSIHHIYGFLTSTNKCLENFTNWRITCVYLYSLIGLRWSWKFRMERNASDQHGSIWLNFLTSISIRPCFKIVWGIYLDWQLEVFLMAYIKLKRTEHTKPNISYL